MRIHDEDFLRYYWEELFYLRRAGESFARSYPKVAARLELQGGECPDPHVERLLESFAFLTARIQKNLDNDYPEIATELLDVLYPQYLHPIPSLAVARFDVDPGRGKLTSGYRVPRHTQLFAQSAEAAVCRFRTCYDVTLWPLEVRDAFFATPESFPFLDTLRDVASVLVVRLASRADPFEKLELDRLRFHLNGDSVLIGRLYELLLNDTLGVAVRSEGLAAPRLLPAEAVEPVGFGDDEAILPAPPQAQPAYRLLQEYFVFPDKFHFFDVTSLAGTASGPACDLLFLLRRAPRSRLSLDRETFALGCTPIVNLFAKTTEPVRIDHRRLEYRLVADSRREKTTEIHSILTVSGTADPTDSTRAYAPFYAWSHEMEQRGQRLFWHARRALSLEQDVGGTEMLLSFLDKDFNPAQPPTEAVWAHTLCTNRGLAEQLPAGAVLQTDVAAPANPIVCLKKPTGQIAPPLGGQTLWRLVSHLSLNYLALSAGEDSLKALKEILRLYSPSDAPSIQQQISGVAAMAERKVTRRFGADAWRGFCRGTEVTLTFDESLYVGGSALLFAAVLNQFLALFASANSFTQLAVRSLQQEGVWKRWPPMAGGRIVL